MGKLRRFASRDPCYRIQKEIEQALSLATDLLEDLSLGVRKREEVADEIDTVIRIVLRDLDVFERVLEGTKTTGSFHLTDEERLIREEFAVSAREFTEEVRGHVGGEVQHWKDSDSRMSGSFRYSRLDQEDVERGESSSNATVSDMLLKQDRIMRQQDDELELVGQSMGTLKNMSHRIGQELEQQSIMLDELGEDMERVDSKLDSTMKKIAKLTKLEDENQQCKAIIILSIVLFFLVFLLIVL